MLVHHFLEYYARNTPGALCLSHGDTHLSYGDVNAAANRLARHLARIRTGDEEPSPEANRLALRDVVRHCIHGVDINEMAVELCKVGLWLETLDPGRPLSLSRTSGSQAPLTKMTIPLDSHQGVIYIRLPRGQEVDNSKAHRRRAYHCRRSNRRRTRRPRRSHCA